MKKFKKIYVEIVNSCNLSCPFCPDSSKEKRRMSVAEIDIVFEKIKPYTDFVYLHVKGEPLLHPELEKILASAETSGLRVNITTNGTKIREKSDVLLKSHSIRQINFSLHSLFNIQNEQLKDDYLNKIFGFCRQALSETEIIISLRLWNLDSNNAINIEKQKNRDILERIEKEFDYSQIEEKLVPGRGIKLRERLFVNFEPEFIWPRLDSSYENSTGFCYGLRTHAAILVDGTVVPCCLDDEGKISLGNIFENSMDSILQSEKTRLIFEGFSRHKAVEKLCKHCSFKEKLSQ